MASAEAIAEEFDASLLLQFARRPKNIRAIFQGAKAAKIFGSNSRAGVAILLLGEKACCVLFSRTTSNVRIHYRDIGDYLSNEKQKLSILAAGLILMETEWEIH